MQNTSPRKSERDLHFPVVTGTHYGTKTPSGQQPAGRGQRHNPWTNAHLTFLENSAYQYLSTTRPLIPLFLMLFRIHQLKFQTDRDVPAVLFLLNLYSPHALSCSSWFQKCTTFFGRNRVASSTEIKRGILVSSVPYREFSILLYTGCNMCGRERPI